MNLFTPTLKKYSSAISKVFHAGLLSVFCASFILTVSLGFPKSANALPAFLQPSCSSESCKFHFLAPINFPGFNISGGTVDVAGNGASGYIKGLYTFGIAIASALAVIVIIIGGVQYASTDAIQGKSDGKERIKAALTGLVLALLSYTLLNTLNPQLVTNNFSAQEIVVASTNASTGNGAVVPVTGGGDGPGVGTDPYSPDVAQVNGEEAARLDAAAKAMIGKETCYVSSTNNGTRACAYVVNAMVNDALGAPIEGDSNDPNSYGRSTATMYNNLKTSDRFHYAGNDLSQAQPGDVIISPTVGSNTGHAGIYTSNGTIAANSTSQTKVDDYYTPAKWTSYYKGTKGLETYIYRPTQLNTD